MTEKIKLKITTITPVTIGSGAELSPYSDYVIENGQICFIDKNKMQNKILQKGDHYLDLYIQGVAMGMDNNRSTFDLKGFLLNNKIVQNIDEVISSRCPLTGNPDSKLPIKAVIKSPLAEPYFPGSSIKGALKTVLMYNWLKKTDRNAEKAIERVINGGNFEFLEKKFEYRELQDGNFIPNTIQQVTDSKMLPRDSNIVVDCYRAGIPLRFECISIERTVELELTLKNCSWEKLSEWANDYAFDSLNQELKVVENRIKRLNKEVENIENEELLTSSKSFIEKLKNYKSRIYVIQDLINDESNFDTNTAYIRIGFGKGYYLNSLGIAIYDYVDKLYNEGEEDLYFKFEDFIRKQFSNDANLDDFPKTRLFVTKTQEPLGWIKIEKLNKNL